MSAESYQPLVSCLMATYGRHRMVERAIACFLMQDYRNRELIILNTHAVPLSRGNSHLPGVRIYNEPCWSTLGDQRNRLLDLANGDLIRTWDDDDIYLPQSISQGVAGVSSHSSGSFLTPAWKPRQSWYSPDNGKTLTLAENIHEPSITFRADIARKYRYFSGSSGDEHIGLIDGINNHEGGFTHGDVGAETGFCYVWGQGTPSHISGSIGNGKSATERAAIWRSQQLDVSRKPLKPDWGGAEKWFKRIEEEKWKLLQS